MKIGFVIGSLDYSGAEKIARYLIDELVKQGNQIGVILLSKDAPYSNMNHIKQFPIFKQGNMLKRVWERQKSIKAIVTQEKYDIVVSFGVKFNLDVMEALKHSRIPVILCERNDPVSDPQNILLRLRRRLAYPCASGFVFQTERIADFFGKKIKSRAAIIPNFIESVDAPEYGERDNVIVITARLDERQKNISMLLRAFKQFNKDSNYTLHIVGDGPDRRKYEDYIAENGLTDSVILEGRQSVYPFLEKAQIFVLCSNYEGMPNSLIEAMAYGLPCIATDCSGGGAAALIENEENGLLIPVNDEAALIGAMERLADDCALRYRLSANAISINERLKLSTIIEKWVNYITNVAQIKKA